MMQHTALSRVGTDGRVRSVPGSAPLSRETFLRRVAVALIRHLQNLVGTDEVDSYVSSVGAALGRDIDARFRAAKGVDGFDADGVATLLVEAKRQIGGRFEVADLNEDRIVLSGRGCPFGTGAIGCTALCQTTANVCGRIAADNLGYARVTLDKTIARGDGECLVTIWRKPSDAEDDCGNEYYRVAI